LQAAFFASRVVLRDAPKIHLEFRNLTDYK